MSGKYDPIKKRKLQSGICSTVKTHENMSALELKQELHEFINEGD